MFGALGRRRRWAAALPVALVLVAAPAHALPGPPLREPAAALQASWGCTGTFTADGPIPVLLVHGAIGTAGQWESNYELVLRKAGHPVCEVSVPGRALLDAQRSVEYVVTAIRGTYALAHRRIAVVAHSMGAELSTYALRFWPDLADEIQDVVGLSGVYEHGTTAAPALCRVACPPAARQITPGSRFLAALAAKPLFAGPDYTTIATAMDELVVPQPAAGVLNGVPGITLQDLCPGRVVDHVSVIDDAVAYALFQDAVTHPGPADPARAAPVPCDTTAIPGSNPAGLSEEAGRFTQGLGPFAANPPPEPPLRCYLDPACAKARLRPAVAARAARAGTRIAVTGSVVQPPGAIQRCAGTVTITLSGSRTRAHAPVAPGCGFDRVLHGSPRARRVRVSYGGSHELLGARVTAPVRSAPAAR